MDISINRVISGVCQGNLFSFVFPSLVRPEPIGGLSTDDGFKFVGADFRNLIVGERFRIFGDGFECATILSSCFTLHVEKEYGGVDLLTYALCACKDGGILIEEVHPEVYILLAGCLVGNKPDDTFLPFRLEAHDFT